MKVLLNLLKSTNHYITKNHQGFIFYLIIALCAYFQLFYKLDELTIRLWDEGKNAVSAFEMLKNGNFLVRYYEGKPDMWGLKPPLLTWCQVLLMKTIGINEWAIRLPSALSAFMTVLLISHFIKKELKQPVTGMIFAFILLTSNGYLSHHIARSGDHDSMLVFFLTVQLIYFYKYLRYPEKKNQYLIIVTICLILAGLTKGIASMFFIPGFLIYIIVINKMHYVFYHRQFYICSFCFIFFLGGYYLLREYNNPGYLNEVWNNELFLRYTNHSPNYSYSFLTEHFFYFKNFWESRLVPWIYLLPVVFFFLFRIKNQKIRHFITYLLFPMVTFLMIISFGTKNLWYDAPIYPILAIMLSFGLYQIYADLFSIAFLNKSLKYGIAIILSAVLIYFPIKQTQSHTFETAELPWDFEIDDIAYYLRHQIQTGQNPGNLCVSYTNYHSHILFYMNILNDKGNNISFTDYQDIEDPITIIASEKKVKKYIEKNYPSEKIDSFRTAMVYMINP